MGCTRHETITNNGQAQGLEPSHRALIDLSSSSSSSTYGTQVLKTQHVMDDGCSHALVLMYFFCICQTCLHECQAPPKLTRGNWSDVWAAPELGAGDPSMRPQAERLGATLLSVKIYTYLCYCISWFSQTGCCRRRGRGYPKCCPFTPSLKTQTIRV